MLLLPKLVPPRPAVGETEPKLAPEVPLGQPVIGGMIIQF